MNQPLIVRVVTATDWTAAYRLLWRETFGRAGAGHEIPMRHVRWPARRSLCLVLANDAIEEWGDQELADAWAILGADPTPPASRAFKHIADAVADDPSLLDDDAFAEALAGWRFIALVSSGGEQDLIATARKIGATLEIDKDGLLEWCQSWVGRTA